MRRSHGVCVRLVSGFIARGKGLTNCGYGIPMVELFLCPGIRVKGFVKELYALSSEK